MLVFSSIASRAAAISLLLIRLAFSKGNSLKFFIALPFAPTRSPRADDAANPPFLALCKDYHHHAIVGFADQPLP
jgi:hypothetical protein